ncbi:hypothetical protein WN51_12271 [Melipona quadrifasciata]|uniref:Uncharacterized protein n=1 Tax=Melipona quadrifasciata TaxID=166423 RepID=A0A0M9A1X1_9HYME|nr:hypothetical protein WN51_12271 [Melipona quadrifasciata]
MISNLLPSFTFDNRDNLPLCPNLESEEIDNPDLGSRDFHVQTKEKKCCSFDISYEKKEIQVEKRMLRGKEGKNRWKRARDELEKTLGLEVKRKEGMWKMDKDIVIISGKGEKGGVEEIACATGKLLHQGTSLVRCDEDLKLAEESAHILLLQKYEQQMSPNELERARKWMDQLNVSRSVRRNTCRGAVRYSYHFCMKRSIQNRGILKNSIFKMDIKISYVLQKV